MGSCSARMHHRRSCFGGSHGQGNYSEDALPLTMRPSEQLLRGGSIDGGSCSMAHAPLVMQLLEELLHQVV
jgi:hypothetical protein